MTFTSRQTDSVTGPVSVSCFNKLQSGPGQITLDVGPSQERRDQRVYIGLNQANLAGWLTDT